MPQSAQLTASKAKAETTDQSPDTEKSASYGGRERRRHPRISADTSEAESAQSVPNRLDRRKSDRRSVDSMRADMKWTVASKVEEKGLSALFRSMSLKPSRIALLFVAVLTGGLAAFMAVQRDQPATQALLQPVAEVVQEARTQILVATETIGIGQRLSGASVAWEDWPEGSVRQGYITLASAPDAIPEMSGTIARFEFFPGEPIREQKLVSAEQGYLSAVLGSGMRGVSVSVSAASASGGFIVPNDHVDVVLTRTSASNQISETILRNVRVVAINTRLGETGTTGAPLDPENPRAEVFAEEAIATLELDTAGAEAIISASNMGELSLVLRSIVDFAEEKSSARTGVNAVIRVSSPFWTQSSEQAGLR